jgi:HPt (histidine-containing phosphotransfer) domain-containing protein
MTDTPILNLDQVADLRAIDGGQGAALGRLVRKFVDSAPERVADIRRLATGAPAEDLARLAHSLKGSSANLGAARLSLLCARLEAAAKGADATLARELASRLDDEMQTACRALMEAAGLAQ